MAYISDYSTLKDFILSSNPYFDRGFANVFKESKSNLPLHRNESGEMDIVFPNDNYGNYFYLRNDEGFALRPDATVCDGILSLSITAGINLVVVIRDANPDVLADNILKTLSKFKGFIITPVSINWNREQILIDEMSGADENDILKGLQNLSNQTILRVRFQAVTNYTSNNCPVINPCKCS